MLHVDNTETLSQNRGKKEVKEKLDVTVFSSKTSKAYPLDRPISYTRNQPSHSVPGLERLGSETPPIGLVKWELPMTWFLTTGLYKPETEVSQRSTLTVVQDPQKSCRTTRTFKPSGPVDHRNFQV